MKPLIYALIIIMIVDAFLLAFFIIRTVQKKRLKKNKSVENEPKRAVNKAENVENKNIAKLNKTAKKNKLTKHSSFGKIKVNEEALKQIFAGYDKDEEKKEENDKLESEAKPQPKQEEEKHLDAVFEDFKIEEKVEEEKKEPTRFRSPFHSMMNERRAAALPKEEIKDDENDEEEDDFDTSDIEQAYQDFLMRKKQEYLKKYEDELNEEDDEDVVNNDEKLKKYTLNNFKDDYFNKHKDISEIVDKLSDEDKNKILSILLSKNTIDESDFDS